ncbi:MAG: hypothetical protein R3E95_10570 [Thiolinea sp.]
MKQYCLGFYSFPAPQASTLQRHNLLACLKYLIVVPWLFAWLLLAAPAQAACTEGVCVMAGSRLVGIDTEQSALLSPLLSGLLGTQINLSVLDWQGLAGAQVNLLSMLNVLQTDMELASPQQVLDSDVSLLSLVQAIKSQQTDAAVISALDSLLTTLGPLTPTIRLGDLLQTDNTSEPQLASVFLDVLPLLTGSIQLFNYENVLTTPEPIVIDGALLSALGLPPLLPSVQLYAQVVEPPVYRCGSEGSEFHTASIRLKLDLDLSNLGLVTDSLEAAVSDLLGLVDITTTANLSLNQLSLYVELARADGVIQSLDPQTGAVTVAVTPSVADMYLGSIDDALFFNRLHAIDPATDVLPASIGTLDLTVEQALLLGGSLNLLDLSSDVLVRAVAQGSSELPDILNFLPPYPQTQIASNNLNAVPELLSSLFSSLTIELGNTGVVGLTNDILNVVLDQLRTLVVDALSPLLEDVTNLLLDPLLSLLGVGIGQAEVTVLGDPMGCDVGLELIKSVWNMTRDADGATAFPGDTLRYNIRYRNSGQLPIQEVVVYDTVPQWTQLVTGSLGCTPLPVELPDCQKIVQNDHLQWRWPANVFLQSGSEGVVYFDATVQ